MPCILPLKYTLRVRLMSRDSINHQSVLVQVMDWAVWQQTITPPIWREMDVFCECKIWFMQRLGNCGVVWNTHDDVIKWKPFPRHWPFVRGIHRSPVNSPHKGQWRGAFMFSLICARINGRVNNREAGDLSRHRTHYDVTGLCVVKIWEETLQWHKHQLTRYDVIVMQNRVVTASDCR